MAKDTSDLKKLEAEVLFASDLTCCLCQERGKAIQIHHIDGNHSNNVMENLSVLCLECHNKTLLKGGFGRQLDASQVVLYRNNWVDRVKKRRDDADRIAVSLMLNKHEQIETTSIGYKIEIQAITSHDAIIDYVVTLPQLRREMLNKAQPEWDTGVTRRIVSASYEYIANLEGILVRLSRFYPGDRFSNNNPHKFFSEKIASRFLWHREILEPNGYGTGGTIVNVACTENVIEDVENMVVELVQSLTEDFPDFNWCSWLEGWKGKR